MNANLVKIAEHMLEDFQCKLVFIHPKIIKIQLLYTVNNPNQVEKQVNILLYRRGKESENISQH